MADDLIEKLKNLRKTLEDSNQWSEAAGLIKNLNNLKNKLDAAGGSNFDLENTIKSVKEKMEGLISTTEAHGDVMDKAKQKNTSFIESIKDIAKAIGPAGAAMASTVKKVAGNLIELAAFGTRAGRELIGPLSDTGDLIGAMSDKAQKANQVLRQFAAVQTTARDALVISGLSLEKNKDIITDYPQVLRRMSAATGLSTRDMKSMADTMNILGKDGIEPTTKGVLSLTSGMMTTITPAAAIATTMRGIGFNSREAADMAVKGFLQFNQTTMETVGQMGRVAAASKATGTNTKTTTEQIIQASSHLAIFGRKSADATNIWSTFATTLKASGVPIKEVGDIVDKVVGSIAGMSVQNRAFIGMMSGLVQGASALGGGLKLEMAMRQEGGMEKNLDALTQSLARFGGGKVITLEEAANNPQLEMQFQIQRQMLGKLTGITSQEQQNRVLETLQGVQRGGVSSIDGQKALQDAFKTGKSVQEKSLTVLERSESYLRLIAGGTLDRKIQRVDDALRPGFRGLAGLGGGKKDTIGKEASQTANLDVARDLGRASVRAGRAITTTPASERQPAGTAHRVVKALTDGGKTEVRRTSPAAQKTFRKSEVGKGDRFKVKTDGTRTAPDSPTYKATLPMAATALRQSKLTDAPTSDFKLKFQQQSMAPARTLSEGLRQAPAAIRDREMNKTLTAMKSTAPVRAETIAQDITPKFKGALGDDTATASAATPGKVSVTPATVSSSTVIIKIEGGLGTEQVKDQLMGTINNWALGMRA